MNFAEAFKILEIEPTNDKKKIKVAYSKMLKKYHPEDFPEMFMRINEAYETALGYTENNFSENLYENTQNFRKTEEMKESDFSDIFDSKTFEKKEDKFTEKSEERQAKEKFFEKKENKNKYEKLNIFEYLKNSMRTEDRFTEAFKILEMEPTTDKEKIKKKYKELLKRYHRNNSENYDKIFSRINEAYGIALGFEQSNFNEYEGDSIEDIFDNFFNSANNSSYKSFFEKTQDFSNVFDQNEITNKSISAWLGRLKNLLLSEKRPLTEYREILRDFHFNFDVSEKNQIREILQKNGLCDYAWRNITRIEMELLIYNLNNSNTNADILGETWVDTGKSENISLDEIVKNIVSENFSENEKGYEKFIQDYFNIKIFRLFGKNIALYPYRDIEQVGATFKFITYKIRNEYVDVNKYIEIFDREQKNKKIGISLRITSYLWSIFGAIVLFLFFLNPIVDWYIGILGTIFFIILDWVNIAKEKEFEWSMQYGYSSYLSILMSIMFVVNLIVIGNAEYESSIIPFLLYSQLIFQFVVLNIILFVKMVVTTNIRYKRLREFSKKVLDVLVLKK
ncbi:J domain-containing protein [Leptotrichia hongkongensis]|uniref:J domain-containing protein n=1 Tax=Leptotrichia hongkongensis TaxID=554406 RepID=A0ABV4S6A6_9FUSO